MARRGHYDSKPRQGECGFAAESSRVPCSTVGLETAAPAVPGVRPPIKALCVVPMGMEEGTETDVPGPEIGLIVGEPAQFRFLGSTVRREDLAGTTLERWNSDELQELPPLETALEAVDMRSGEPVPVRLHSRDRGLNSSSLRRARAPATAENAGSSNSTYATRTTSEWKDPT